MKLIIQGCTTKKTSQRIIVNRRTGKPMIIPSKDSKAWEISAIAQLCEQWYGVPLDCDVQVKAVIYRPAKRGDLTGFLQAIGDALQGGGSRKKDKRTPCVLLDDAQIKSFDGSRLALDRDNPRVELEILPMEDASGE